MTAQFSSHLTLDDVSYNVTDAEPYPIFHPNMLGRIAYGYLLLGWLYRHL